MSKTWFITGASRGLGRVLAEEVLQAGHKVIATARNAEDLADLSQKFGNSVKAVTCEVSSPIRPRRSSAAAPRLIPARTIAKRRDFMSLGCGA